MLDIFRNKLLAKIAVVSSGTLVGQLILVAFSPVLSRIYTPTEIGQFATFFAFTSTVLPLACFRYDMAIPLPRHDNDGLALLWLTGCLVPFVSVSIGFILWINRGVISRWSNCELLFRFAWMFPVMFVSLALLQVLNYWAIRKQEFHLLARAKALRAITLAGCQFAFSALGAVGLVLSHTVASICALTMLSIRLLPAIRVASQHRSAIRKVARRFKNFPCYSAISGVVNMAGLGMPIILLSAYYGDAAAGQLGLLHRVLALPVGLIGTSVADVYLSEAANAMSENRLGRLFLKMSSGLAVVGILFAATTMMFGPRIISLALGKQWSDASSWSQVIGLMLAFQLIVSPVSQTLNVVDMQWLMLAWDLLRLAAVFAAFEVSRQLNLPVGNAVALYCFSMIAAYVLLWVTQFAVLALFTNSKRFIE